MQREKEKTKNKERLRMGNKTCSNTRGKHCEGNTRVKREKGAWEEEGDGVETGEKREPTSQPKVLQEGGGALQESGVVPPPGWWKQPSTKPWYRKKKTTQISGPYI